MAHVVTWDPTGQQDEGALIADEVARALRNKGAATMPIEPDLMRIGAAAGYHRRGWGSGWTMSSVLPARIVPMVLWVARDVPNIHWQARLTPSPELQVEGGIPKGGLVGRLVLAADTAQQGVGSANLEQAERGRVDFEDLGQPDAHGGWTVGGRASIRQMTDGFVGLSLYGFGRGLRIKWSAITQTRS
jgi:hypothetical protein